MLQSRKAVWPATTLVDRGLERKEAFLLFGQSEKQQNLDVHSWQGRGHIAAHETSVSTKVFPIYSSLSTVCLETKCGYILSFILAVSRAVQAWPWCPRGCGARHTRLIDYYSDCYRSDKVLA